ncbi:hypothetical protein [Bacillus cereus]|uniref:hypothetical protein n=1 Tax=Bacillus cereus TaxID=1396 RepID=UPI0038FC655C
MKLLSKKVMTGLLVGAMGLSIWVPISEAAPQKDRYYTINLKANPNLAWDVLWNSTDNNAPILLYNGDRRDNEQFAFFPRISVISSNSLYFSTQFFNCVELLI